MVCSRGDGVGSAGACCTEPTARLLAWPLPVLQAYRAVVLEQQAQHELEAPQAAPEAAAPQAMA